MNFKGTDFDAGWTEGGGIASIPVMTLKQNDWCWYPVAGSSTSGISAGEGRGVAITNTSGSAVATVEYGIYKKN